MVTALNPNRHVYMIHGRPVKVLGVNGTKTCELSVMHRFFWPRSGFVGDSVQKL